MVGQPFDAMLTLALSANGIDGTYLECFFQSFNKKGEEGRERCLLSQSWNDLSPQDVSYRHRRVYFFLQSLIEMAYIQIVKLLK